MSRRAFLEKIDQSLAKFEDKMYSVVFGDRSFLIIAYIVGVLIFVFLICLFLVYLPRILF